MKEYLFVIATKTMTNSIIEIGRDLRAIIIPQELFSAMKSVCLDKLVWKRELPEGDGMLYAFELVE